MAWFETPLLVVHNFVGKHEDWLAACSDYLGSLGVSDYGVEDYPLFDGAEGEVLVVPSGCLQSLVETKFSAH